MDEDRNEHYGYFEQKPSKWDIIEFLEQCDLEPYGKKVDRYIRCLRCIARSEQKKRKEKAEELLRRYSNWRDKDPRSTRCLIIQGHSHFLRPPSHKISAGAQTTHVVNSLGGLMFKAICLPTIVDLGDKPDQQRVKDWEKTRKSSKTSGGSSIHIHNIHNSTLSGNSLTVAGNTSTTKATTEATTKRKRESLRKRKVASYAESSTDTSSDSNCEESRS
ncbi:17893_t:CDS:2, partial [Acaulospora morrowiae]